MLGKKIITIRDVYNHIDDILARCGETGIVKSIHLSFDYFEYYIIEKENGKYICLTRDDFEVIENSYELQVLMDH